MQSLMYITKKNIHPNKHVHICTYTWQADAAFAAKSPSCGENERDGCLLFLIFCQVTQD